MSASLASEPVRRPPRAPRINGRAIASAGIVALLLLLSSAGIAAASEVAASHRPAPTPSSPPMYPLVFQETGLPGGTNWSVTLGGSTASAAAGQNITLREANGTYSYSLGGPFGYQPAAGSSSGTVTVAGAPNSVVILNLAVGRYPNGVAYDPLLGQLFVTDGGAHNVTVLNGSTNSVAGTPLPVGTDPFGIAFDPVNGYLYVANEESGNVTVLNGANDTVVVPGIGVGSQPIAVAVDPANDRIFVANAGGADVSVINGSTGRALASAIPVGRDPDALAYDPANGFLYVANGVSDNVTVVNASTGAIVVPSIPVGTTPDAVAYDPQNGAIYVANFGGNNLTRINGSTDRTVGGAIALPANTGPVALAFDPASDELYAVDGLDSNVTVVDAATGQVVVPLLRIGIGPEGIAWDAANGELYVADNGEGTSSNVTVINGNGLWQTTWTVAPEYSVSFTETGLPTGATWNVTLNGVVHSGTAGRPIAATLPNGTFSYRVGADGWIARPSSGSVTIDGAAPAPVAIAFTPANFTAIFTEGGLPTGAAWSVTVAPQGGGGLLTNRSTGTEIGFALPNGSYTYHVGPAGAHRASAPNGNFSITGTSASIAVAFGFWTNLSFDEVGLPAGTTWAVNLSNPSNGTTWSASSGTSTIAFEVLSNSTYTYAILAPSGYTLSHSLGRIQVGSGSANVTAEFGSPLVSPPPVTPAATPFPWLYVIAALGAIAVIGILVVLLRRRRGGGTSAPREIPSPPPSETATPEPPPPGR